MQSENKYQVAAPSSQQSKSLPSLSGNGAIDKKLYELGVSQAQWDVMAQQFFPKATSKESILLVASYCKARNLDLMSKPFHIVPTWDSETRKYTDSIWPAINLYETTAHRTGEFAGKDEAVYGPMTEFSFGGNKFTAPEWCKVTVYRMVKGVKCAFTSDPIFFEEAVILTKDKVPNSMWTKRPRGQLGKNALSAALRLAFPECGSEPTGEEMGATVVDTSEQLVAQMQVAKAEAAQEATDVEEVHEDKPTVASPLDLSKLMAAAKAKGLDKQVVPKIKEMFELGADWNKHLTTAQLGELHEWINSHEESASDK